MSNGEAIRHLAPLAALAGVLLLPAMARAAGEPPAVTRTLKACAAIAANTERLACYDQLAGRPAAAPATATPVATPPQAVAEAPAPLAGPAATSQPPAAPSAPGAFGLYTAEHPTAPAVEPSLTVRVQAIGRSASGRMTVTVEGGALWELGDGDPLLKAGDTVTIRRASLGSFLLETPTRRTHHAQRLR